jgi:hypothetical protein
MLPDGPPPVPKHKYFKELIKPKIIFGFFIPFVSTDMLQRNILWLLSTLDQITT